jgi:tetratricopeptide (TPR) repeat protein
MEQFVTQYPKHEAVPWVLEMLQPAYVKAGNIDKIIETGEKMAALDPDDIECALQTLKAVETKKDPDLIKKWSAATSAAARKYLASSGEKRPSDIEYAKQVDTYTEYTLYRAAVETPDPKKKLDLIETLEQRNPSCEYIAKFNRERFMAYRQTGANDKALALAEKVLATDQSDEQMLLVVADNYMQQKKEPEKVVAYTARIVELVNGRAKPANMTDEDWQKHKGALLCIAHFIGGKQQFVQNKFAAADKELREALPHIDASPALKPELLFYLGVANYKLEKPQEAANFFRACAAIKSPFQAEANKNVLRIRTEYRGIK